MTRARDDDPAAPGDAPEADAPAVEAPLLELRDGLPPVIETHEAFDETVDIFASGTGPFAIDAERASGYRYSQRAYLIQMRREGAGTALIDPLPFAADVPSDVFAPLNDAVADAEWIIHAASQDLVCLAELGLRPTTLFDTELAGRLLNYPRVGLAVLVEELLGSRMRKEHSAVDWSRRPLPEPWLSYAALDVEALIELRDVLAGQLEEAGKAEWARQEFAAWVASFEPAPRIEPWRRTSGIHRVRGRRGLALVRAMWERRDELARNRDVTSNRILPDSAIVAAAAAAPSVAHRLGSGRGLRDARRSALPQGLRGRDLRSAGAARRRAAHGLASARRSPAAALLVRQGPGCRRAVDSLPRRGARARGGARPAPGEPALARRRTPAGLATAEPTLGGDGDRLPHRRRRPPLAGRPHRRRRSPPSSPTSRPR